MSALNTTTSFLAAAILVAGGLACRKPAPAPPVVKPVAATAPDTRTDDSAKRQADQKRQAEQAEASRKAAAMAAYERAASAALKDVHFAFDSSEIQGADKATLSAIADFMKAYPQANVAIDGNCDERGTGEYNLALGERRAHAAMAFLAGLGVADGRLTMMSYGKEKPVCTESTESCWGRNRRAHFTLK
jgi:peptidoglycan-associated lipoprotein